MGNCEVRSRHFISIDDHLILLFKISALLFLIHHSPIICFPIIALYALPNPKFTSILCSLFSFKLFLSFISTSRNCEIISVLPFDTRSRVRMAAHIKQICFHYLLSKTLITVTFRHLLHAKSCLHWLACTIAHLPSLGQSFRYLTTY